MVALPSLRGLQAFEAAARTGSFAAAAEELSVSAAAVSQLIRTVEEQMGRKLFHRVNRRAVLTEAGVEMLPRLSMAFREIGSVARDVGGGAFRPRLVVSVPPSMAMGWLSERLAGFVAGLPCEVEIISLDGEAKEATVWFGAAVSATRRATRLPEGVTWTDRMGDGSLDDYPTVSPAIGRWLYDADPALSRSGLLDSFARAHGLGRIAADLPYLTSDDFLATPWLEAFEVLEVHPLDLKKLRRLIDAQSLGPVQVKHKTTDLKPEALRPLLRSKGESPTVLFLTGGAGPGRAFVTRKSGPHAVDSPGRDG